MLLKIAACAKLGVEFFPVGWVTFEIGVRECCEHVLCSKSGKMTKVWISGISLNAECSYPAFKMTVGSVSKHR